MVMDATEFPIVTTFSGPVRGRRENGLVAFRGIRYGASTTGAERFKPSRRPQPWAAPVDALSFGAAAMQMPMGLADVGDPSPVRSALEPILPAPEDKATQSEDCLFLNVWTPGLGDGRKRPVMIWLHGGGFAAGSAGWPVCDGAALARNGDVVVVSLNHRLNVFGFLYLGELAGPEYAQSGNAGMLDVMLALWWVRDNIAKFGGNPADVTVFGESGGGLKVSTLLAMRSARGLLHKAIIQSGPGVRCLSKDAAAATARNILHEAGLELPQDMERLHSLPASALVSAAIAVQRREQAAGRSFALAPVMDAITMAGHPFEPVAAATGAKVSLLVGHTKDEGTFFIATDAKFGVFTEEDLKQRAGAMAPGKSDALIAALSKTKPRATPTELIADLFTATWAFSGSVTLAERKSRQEAPVYAYMLTWETPVVGGALGATHALDLPMMFNTVESARALVGPGEAPQRIADQMHAAWIAFASTGNPNAPGLPHWPPYEATRRATMMFDLESRVVDDPWPEVRRVLLSAPG
jgi:para-nitrobenzyl esterase